MAAVELLSPTLETLLLSPVELSASGGAGDACAFPRLSALTYDCTTGFNSVFKELPVLKSLHFGSRMGNVS